MTARVKGAGTFPAQEERRKEDPRAAFKQACYLPEDGMA